MRPDQLTLKTEAGIHSKVSRIPRAKRLFDTSADASKKKILVSPLAKVRAFQLTLR